MAFDYTKALCPEIRVLFLPFVFVPVGLAMMYGTQARRKLFLEVNDMSWSHEAVYQALVERGERIKRSPINPYVVLYPQEKNCAILYSPNATQTRNAPLHLNEARDSWRTDVFERISPALEFVRRDNKGPGKDSQNFSLYRVIDWDLFAEGVGL